MSGPTYCPFCGAHESLKSIGGCLVEDGEYDECSGEFAAEGLAIKFRCRECGQAFVEWDPGEEFDAKYGEENG